MNAFTGDLTMTEMALEWREWRLEQPLTFGPYTVPAGFVTDGASVPRPLWWFLPAWGRYSRAAVVHDYLCRNKIVSRAEADRVFFDAMVVCGVNVTVRWLIWGSVRLYAILARK